MEKREVTLSEVLDARERRVWIQNELIGQEGCPVISFTMNIAGPVKVTELTARAFEEGRELLERALRDRNIPVKKSHILREHTGYEAFYSVDSAAETVKDLCVKIEEGITIGRLFDMDVIGTDGKKLDRAHERSCIVCGREGRYCASRRVHSVQELQEATNRILTEYFTEKDAEYYAECAAASMIEEVYTTPKPGLVDRNNNGSHDDMDIPLFVKSALSLRPYFQECFRLGYMYRNEEAQQTFPYLRQAGLEAEKTMFKTTDGVNTHKGALFHFGLLCGALGRLFRPQGGYTAEEVTDTVRQFAQEILMQELSDLKEGKTAGEKLYQKYGIYGARGEAIFGYPSVREISLPVFTKTRKETGDRNHAGVKALLSLIAHTEDTNMIKRGGRTLAEDARNRTRVLLEKEKISDEDLLDLDRYFIDHHLSPGGCADLLAVTYFLYDLTRE